VLLIDRIIGSRLDPALSERLHDLEHHDAVDQLIISPADVARRRFRATTKRGADLAIALPREQQLFDGAVLLLDDRRALVVRLDEQRWLRLEPSAIADAIELGFRAGNLHWRVKFEAGALLVALEAPEEEYLRRLDGLLATHRVSHTVVRRADDSQT
jgi:urease accessory protein